MDDPMNIPQALQQLSDRITALENKPAIDKEKVTEILADHPVIADFRAFMAKWRGGSN